jgi:hypothetical protein
MKTLFKLGLLASTLLTVATSAYAITGQQIVGLSTTNIETATVPEPSALGLLGLGLVVLALVRRKK